MNEEIIYRRIDDLGRVVIPREIRKQLNIKGDDALRIEYYDGKIVLTKYNIPENEV
jgi:AbrB family transcriptional regulator (stage V sporulation protein T)